MKEMTKETDLTGIKKDRKLELNAFVAGTGVFYINHEIASVSRNSEQGNHTPNPD